MSYHTRYRPKILDDVVGNDSVVAALRNILAKEFPPQSYLFSGPSGCGKTTLARILAYEFGAGELDLMEIDTADFRGIDTIREIRQSMNLAPMCGKRRAFLLDECHQLSKDAMNGLLKALEDTPKHVLFFLCTTEPEKLLPTIRTRCLPLQVELLGIADLRRVIRRVVIAESLSLAKEQSIAIAEAANGSPRSALVLLEKMIPFKGDIGAFKKALVNASDELETAAIDLCRALAGKKSWPHIAGLLKALDEEPERVRHAVLGYTSSMLMNDDNPWAYIIMDCFSTPFYNMGKAGLIKACYESLSAIKG